METQLSQLPVTNEIASVICAKKCVEDKAFLAEMKANPAAQAGVKGKVLTVDNTANTLNICVPDYKMLKDGTLDQITDEHMADVSGGILPLLFAPIIAAAAVAPAVIAAGSAGGAFTAAAAAGSAAVAAGVAVGAAAGVGAFDESTGLYDVAD